jgi:hypothetical protein
VPPPEAFSKGTEIRIWQRQIGNSIRKVQRNWERGPRCWGDGIVLLQSVWYYFWPASLFTALYIFFSLRLDVHVQRSRMTPMEKWLSSRDEVPGRFDVMHRARRWLCWFSLLLKVWDIDRWFIWIKRGKIKRPEGKNRESKTMEIHSIAQHQTWMDEDAQLLTESRHMLCIVKLWKSTWNCCSPTSLLVCRHSEMSLYVCAQSDAQCPIPCWQSSPLIRALVVVFLFSCVCECESLSD